MVRTSLSKFIPIHLCGNDKLPIVVIFSTYPVICNFYGTAVVIITSYLNPYICVTKRLSAFLSNPALFQGFELPWNTMTRLLVIKSGKCMVNRRNCCLVTAG
jgi:hypothetical protein